MGEARRGLGDRIVKTASSPEGYYPLAEDCSWYFKGVLIWLHKNNGLA